MIEKAMPIVEELKALLRSSSSTVSIGGHETETSTLLCALRRNDRLDSIVALELALLA